jgi:hypothetical protein
LGSSRDGKTYAGTSLHAPATEENAEALRKLRRAGFSHFFLDDDFRLARGPGEIGGCFCAEHCTQFLRRTGLPDGRWPELLDDLRSRRLTPLLRQWVDFACDDLAASFRAQQQAADGRLGLMVMYLGAEKAGIRLADYRGVPLRVGELMFDDQSFSPLKGKTDELFSVLFHRRFAAPESAASWPGTGCAVLLSTTGERPAVTPGRTVRSVCSWPQAFPPRYRNGPRGRARPFCRMPTLPPLPRASWSPEGLGS